MSRTGREKQKAPIRSRLNLIALAQLAGLSLLLAFTFVADHRHGQKNIRELAEATAHTHAQKDSIYRDLFIASGGAYLTVSQKIVPELALAHRPDRDILTPAGRVITLVTPKNLFQIASDRLPNHQALKLKYALKTIHPLSQEDTPDRWEKGALRGLQQGRAEISEVVYEEGREVLRYMYPIQASWGCVENRPNTGLKIGDLLGGISVTVPMELYSQQDHTRNSLYLHFILWTLGASGIFWGFRTIKKRDAVIYGGRQALENSYEELEKTFDAIDGIITIQDSDMRITKANRATSETFNLREEELVGKYCYQLFRNINKPCEGCPAVKATKDGVLHLAEIEHKNLGKIFSVTIAPITNSSGETTKFVHYAKDITESRRQERQLRQAQKMEAIGTLAGGIAHDFNNILTAIIGFSELALLQHNLDGTIRKDIDQVHQAGLRAKELVKQILTFSRQGEQDLQPLNIQPVAREALKLLRASIPTTITFETDIANHGTLVIADPSQIHQVIMNLCTNAYHAMRDGGGILTVSLQPVELADMDVRHRQGIKPGPYLCLTIGDTGMGIEKEHQERIFEPYFTTKEKGEGTGLGLSLVHGIVSSMAGYISVHSEEGKGTTFQVYLPVISDTEVAAKGDGKCSGQIPSGSERILIVDDEETIIAMEGRMLEGLGYAVTAFSDAIKAKEAFVADPQFFDLLITDMNMPNLSGLDLVEAVKAVRPHIPIIISTGFSEQINNANAHRYGVQRVIMKPLVLHELAQAVRNALEE